MSTLLNIFQTENIVKPIEMDKKAEMVQVVNVIKPIVISPIVKTTKPVVEMVEVVVSQPQVPNLFDFVYNSIINNLNILDIHDISTHFKKNNMKNDTVSNSNVVKNHKKKNEYTNTQPTITCIITNISNYLTNIISTNDNTFIPPVVYDIHKIMYFILYLQNILKIIIQSRQDNIIFLYGLINILYELDVIWIKPLFLLDLNVIHIETINIELLQELTFVKQQIFFNNLLYHKKLDETISILERIFKYIHRNISSSTAWRRRVVTLIKDTDGFLIEGSI